MCVFLLFLGGMCECVNWKEEGLQVRCSFEALGENSLYRERRELR